jgi:hypothetical protein
MVDARPSAPYPAERLMREAIEAYRKRQDFNGLGVALQTYGDFVRSRFFADWPLFRAMYPDTATPEQRHALAHRYYRDAIDSLRTDLSKEGLAASNRSNDNYLIYHAALADDDSDTSCQALDAMLMAHQQARAADPSARFFGPRGYPSLEDFVASESSRLNCPTTSSR